MKKAWIAAGGVALVGSVAVVGGAFVTGVQAKKELQAAATSWPAQWPMVKVVEQRYDRGLFSATHTMTLQLGCDGDAKGPGPQLLTLRQRVQHGPLPGFSSVGASVITTELVLPEAAAAAFGDKAPLSARTVVGFDGASRTQVTMPAFKFAGPQGQQIDFQGLVADIDAQAGLLRYDMRLPSLVVRGDDPKLSVSMTLSGVRVHGELRGSGSMWLRPGHGEGEVGVWQMSVVPREAGPASPALAMAFDSLKFSSTNTLDKDLLGSVAQLTGRGSVNGFKLDKLELQASLKRLHAPSYERLLQRVMDTGATACGMQQAVSPQVFLAQLQQDVAALLPFNPEYALDKLVVESGGRRAELSYAIGVEGAGAEDAKLSLPALLMTKGKLRGQARLPLPWVEQAMQSFGGAGQPADAAAQAEMMNVMLTKVTADGFVTREGDMLSTQFSVDKGQVLVNGKPVGQPAPH